MIPIVFLKSVSKKYKDDFEKGVIHFSRPIDWIKMELKGNKGQGDINEGTIGFKNGISIRRFGVLNHYCFCIYALKDIDFKKDSIDGSGEPGKEYLVEKKYFDDFDNNNPDNNIIFMLKPQIFIDKVIDALIKLGIKRDNIILDFIQYMPFKLLSDKIMNIPSPYELLIKDNSFSYQSEYRIIVECDDKTMNIFEKINGNVILKGMSECILQKLDSYNENMLLFLGNDTKQLLFSLPKPIVTDISEYLSDYSREELAEFEFAYLFTATPFFYYEHWLNKLDETTNSVINNYGYAFDLHLFGLIDVKTNNIVRCFNKAYYYNILNDKVKYHYNKGHYETVYNLLLEIRYLFAQNVIDEKIEESLNMIKKAMQDKT